MSAKQKEKGFTIIEVVLVLAIAGLIFMMVFLALPALQRSQRDTQRKNDLSRAITAVTNYTSSNRGVLPTAAQFTGGTFTTSYLTNASDTFVDPLGTPGTGSGVNAAGNYVFSTAAVVPAAYAAATTQNVIFVSIGSICDTSAAAAQGAVTTTGGGSRKIALRVVLESSGIYCVNN